MENKIIKLEDLDLKINSFILLISKRNSGKTVLTRWLIYNLTEKNNYSWIFLFSNTAEFNGDYNFLKKWQIKTFDKFETIMDKIMNHQKERIKMKKIKHILIILDDIPMGSGISKKLNWLATLGRHFKITVILWCQYPRYIVSTWVRQNIDMLFFSDVNLNVIDLIYDCISIPQDKKEFREFVNENNTNYQFIYYNAREWDRKNRIGIVKADLIELK